MRIRESHVVGGASDRQNQRLYQYGGLPKFNNYRSLSCNLHSGLQKVKGMQATIRSPKSYLWLPERTTNVLMLCVRGQSLDDNANGIIGAGLGLGQSHLSHSSLEQQDHLQVAQM
jgi:hypothetical protein